MRANTAQISGVQEWEGRKSGKKKEERTVITGQGPQLPTTKKAVYVWHEQCNIKEILTLMTFWRQFLLVVKRD